MLFTMRWLRRADSESRSSHQQCDGVLPMRWPAVWETPSRVVATVAALPLNRDHRLGGTVGQLRISFRAGADSLSGVRLGKASVASGRRALKLSVGCIW